MAASAPPQPTLASAPTDTRRGDAVRQTCRNKATNDNTVSRRGAAWAVMHSLKLIFCGTSVFKEEEEEMLRDGSLELGFCFLRQIRFPSTAVTVYRLAVVTQLLKTNVRRSLCLKIPS